MGIEALKFTEFFLKLLLDILVPLHLVGPFLELINIVNVGTQFFLDRAYLLLQEVVPLLLGQFFTSARLDTGLDFDQLLLTHEHRVKKIAPFLDVAFLQHMLLLVGIKRNVGGQEVHQVHGIIDVFHGECQFAAILSHVAQHAQGNFGNRLHQDLKFLVSGQRQPVFDQGDRATHIRCRL